MPAQLANQTVAVLLSQAVRTEDLSDDLFAAQIVDGNADQLADHASTRLDIAAESQHDCDVLKRPLDVALCHVTSCTPLDDARHLASRHGVGQQGRNADARFEHALRAFLGFCQFLETGFVLSQPGVHSRFVH